MTAQRTRFPGAHPFSDDVLSSNLFFGRTKETLALRNQVLANRLTILFARSAVGKTSLINAGLSKGMLERGIVPLLVRVNDVKVGALASIYAGIASYCQSHSIEYLPGNTESLWLYFKTAQFWHQDTLLTPVLILDQFEEMFTLQSAEAREAFVREFSPLVRGVRPPSISPASSHMSPDDPAVSETPPRMHILIAIREDFLANLEDFSDRIPEILSERFRLLPLDHAQALEALDEPTRVENPDLITRPFAISTDCQRVILEFLARRPSSVAHRSAPGIEPFQLQLLCQHIEGVAKKLQSTASGRLVEIGLKEIGGAKQLQRILREFYRSQLKRIPFLQRRKARRFCAENLVTPHGRRVRLEESEIQRVCGVTSTTLKLLVEQRVVRRDQTADGDYYELSHDSLIGPAIKAMRSWFIIKSVLLALAGSLIVAYAVLLANLLSQIESLSYFGWFLVLAMLVLAGRTSAQIFRKTRDYFMRSRL